MDLYGMQASDDTSDELNISHLPLRFRLQLESSLDEPGFHFLWKRYPPEKWVAYKVEQAAACDHELDVPIRDDGKPYALTLTIPWSEGNISCCYRQDKGMDDLP
jgi:hypothetical protein